MAQNKSKNAVKKQIKTASKNKNFIVVVAIFLVVAALVFCALFLFGDKIVKLINGKNYNSDIDFSTGLYMDVIDVNQGDAIFIELPDKKTMLIDSGDNGADDTKKFTEYIENKFEGRDKVLDYCILTHPDSDHGGNMAWVFDYFLVKNAYRPNVYCDEDSFIPFNAEIKNALFYKNYVKSMLEEQERYNCKVNAIGYNLEPIVGENYSINFYYAGDPTTKEDWNAYSPIIVLEYFDTRICLTGDAGVLEEKTILENYNLPNCQILKAGHHGSSTSTSTEFLNVLKPNYVLVSLKEGNKYGHPHQEFIDRTNACTSIEKVLYTSKEGTISLFISPELGAKGLVYFYNIENGISIKTLYLTCFCVVGGLFVVTIIIINITSKSKRKGNK